MPRCLRPWLVIAPSLCAFVPLRLCGEIYSDVRKTIKSSVIQRDRRGSGYLHEMSGDV